MLEYIHICNYQSHVNTRIDLAKSTTAIAGLSMSGKTAIKRALELLRKNRPLGFRFNHRYTDEPTIVEVGVDGHRVGFKKWDKPIDADGNTSMYYVVYPDMNVYQSTNFKASVPEEITRVLNISDISIQDQLDAYLLVISSAGEIAKTINRITGIDIGDAWLKDLNSSITKINKSIALLNGEIGFLSNEVKNYEGVDELSEKINFAAEMQSKYDSILARNNFVVDKINQYEVIHKDKIIESNNLTIFNELLSRFEYINNSIKVLIRKLDLINSAAQIRNQHLQSTTLLNYLSAQLNIFETYTTIKGRYLQLNNLVSKYKYAEDQKSRQIIDFEAAKSQWADLLLSMNICYVCGNKISNRDQIIERLK